jgi:indoleamine 2,3-dioxygenase
MSFVSLVYPSTSFIRDILSELTWSHHNKAASHNPIKDTYPKQLHDFDMNSSTGFLPDRPPLDRLPPDFDLWELALASARDSLSLGEDESPEAITRRESSRRWRSQLRNVGGFIFIFICIVVDRSIYSCQGPVLPTDALHGSARCLRRAHHVLAFLVHFYMHSIPPSERSERLVVPASLAVPLVSVSDVLGIAPILTFADTVLWNWDLVDPTKPLAPENLRPQTLFTGGPDERSFYVCCASIELRGVEALRIITDYNNLSSTEDPHVIDQIADSLRRLSTIVDELTTILKSVRANCDPHAFYFDIRPWFRGSDANGPDSVGWRYEGVDPSRHLELSGPSAGQSSTM